MADLAQSIATAKRAGYSDKAVADHLAADPAFGAKVKTARQAGYGDSEIVAHLSAAPKQTGLAGVGKTIVDTMGGAWDKLKQDAQANVADVTDQTPIKGPMDYVRRVATSMDNVRKLPADLAGVAFSPIAGAQEGFLVQPGAKVLDHLPAGYTGGPRLTLHGVEGSLANLRRETPEEQHASNENALRMGLSAVRPSVAAPVNPLASVARGVPVKARMAETVAKFDRAGVTPSIAAVKGGGAATVAKAVSENPVVGGASRKAMEGQVAEAGVSADRIAAKYGTPTSSRTMGEDLQAGATQFAKGSGDKLPIDYARMKSSSQISFGDKSDALYTRAERLIGDTAAPISLPKTSAAIKAATGSFDNAGLNQTFRNPVLADVQSTLQKSGGNLSWNDAKALRSKIRTRLLADPALRATADDAQVNNIYSALTDDLSVGAARIARETDGNNAGLRATQAWHQANRYYRAGMDRMDKALGSVFDAASGEQAYDRVVAAAGSGAKADIRKISAVKRSVRPEQWGDLSATVIHRLGTPSAGAANAAEDGAFSINTFLTNYAKLAPEGREVLFGSKGGGGASATSLKSELDNLAEVTGHLKALDKTANRSNTAVVGQAVGTVAGLVNPHTTLPTLGVLGSMRLTGNMLTSPGAVRWLAKLGKASANPVAVQAQARALNRAARGTAALQPLAAAVREALIAPPAPVSVGVADEKQQ